MIKFFALIFSLSIYLNAQVSYNIFITSFNKDKKDNAKKYQDILKEYLLLNEINKKITLNKEKEVFTIKIVNIETLDEAKKVHSKIKTEFKDSFIQEVQLDTLDKIHKEAMEFLKVEKYEEAYDILFNSYEANNYTNQTLFLLAESAKKNKDSDNAIFFYEELLKLNPTAHRVRLELADLYYQKAEYEKSNEQFLIVKAAKIPTQVEKNIENYKKKKKIENQKNYNLFASLGYMKDSNVNAGPTIDTVTMYDLEFTLSDEAKKTEDDAYTTKVGASFYNSFENFMLNNSLNINQIDYFDLNDYDNKTYSISTNPIFFNNKSIYMFPLTYSNIDLGLSEKYYLKYISFKPTIKKRISSLFLYSLKLNLEKKQYEATPTKDGLTYGLSYGFELQDTSSSSINFEAHINRNSSDDEIYSYNNAGVTLSYSSFIYNRIYFLGNLNFDMNYYDEAEDAFEVKKDEYDLNGSLNFIYDLDLYNSNLTFSYYNQYNSSNIELYKYKRSLMMLSYSMSY